MTDIVERLRESANALQEHIDRLWRPDIEDIRTAADEIDRLRLNVFGLTASDEAKSDIIRKLHDEIERLRTAAAVDSAWLKSVEVLETQKMSDIGEPNAAFAQWFDTLPEESPYMLAWRAYLRGRAEQLRDSSLLIEIADLHITIGRLAAGIERLGGELAALRTRR